MSPVLHRPHRVGRLVDGDSRPGDRGAVSAAPQRRRPRCASRRSSSVTSPRGSASTSTRIASPPRCGTGSGTLAGIRSGHTLPTDRPYPARPRFTGAAHRVELSPELKRRGATPGRP
jgi:hypothetical protein